MTKQNLQKQKKADEVIIGPDQAELEQRKARFKYSTTFVVKGSPSMTQKAADQYHREIFKVRHDLKKLC